jgi:hypothetical protein
MSLQKLMTAGQRLLAWQIGIGVKRKVKDWNKDEIGQWIIGKDSFLHYSAINLYFISGQDRLIHTCTEYSISFEMSKTPLVTSDLNNCIKNVIDRL